MLFKNKKIEAEPAPFDPILFRQQILQDVSSQIQASMEPIVAAIRALNSPREAGHGQEQDEMGLEEPHGRSPMSEAQFRQMAEEAARTAAQAEAKKYVPKARAQARRAFLNTLTDKGREMFFKYEDDVDEVLDHADPEAQNNPVVFEKAFKFAMMDKHEDEYVKAVFESARAEDLPPHLQPPAGSGGSVENEPQLSVDEQFMQQKFDQTYKGGFTPKQWRDFSELNKDENMNIDQMIAEARAKGLIQNGNATAQTNQRNNAQ